MVPAKTSQIKLSYKTFHILLIISRLEVVDICTHLLESGFVQRREAEISSKN